MLLHPWCTTRYARLNRMFRTCGKVGQLENFLRPWRTASSFRMLNALKVTPAVVNSPT